MHRAGRIQFFFRHVAARIRLIVQSALNITTYIALMADTICSYKCNAVFI